MFRIASEPINVHQLQDAMQDLRAGAFASFEGRVRNHNEGNTVTLLEYEAYVPLAEKEAAKIITEATERYGLYAAECVHRVGPLQLGETAVWVGVLAAHRGEAFDACRYIIDEVKHRLPIWKKEHYENGSTGWVNCQHGSSEQRSSERLAASHAVPGEQRKASGSTHIRCSPMHAHSGDECELDVLDLSTADLGKFELVDVREPYEDPGHVLRALLAAAGEVKEMPLSSFDFNNPPLDANKKYLFICAHGVRTRRLAVFLRSRGFKNAYSLIDGFEAVRRKFIA